MTTSQMGLLSVLVSRYDKRNKPVTAAEVAAAADTETGSVQDIFTDLKSKYLVKSVNDGYRPTVTARELLALDIDDDAAVILDTQPESQ
jgi:predicted transcriptional regulator